MIEVEERHDLVAAVCSRRERRGKHEFVGVEVDCGFGRDVGDFAGRDPDFLHVSPKAGRHLFGGRLEGPEEHQETSRYRAFDAGADAHRES